MSELGVNKKAVMRRVYEEMWNESKPEIAPQIFEKPEGVERFVRQFLLAFPDLQHTVEGMIVEGEHIAVRFVARGTHHGQWLEYPPTKRAIQYTGVTWARIAKGRIVQHHTWWDKEALVEQIR